jgi:hypothetical protein
MRFQHQKSFVLYSISYAHFLCIQSAAMAVLLFDGHNLTKQNWEPNWTAAGGIFLEEATRGKPTSQPSLWL